MKNVQKSLTNKYCHEILGDLTKLVEQVAKESDKNTFADVATILEDTKQQIANLMPEE